MKKIFEPVRLSPIGRLRAEYIGLGVLMALLSAFLGFYSAAFVAADKCFPELGLRTLQDAHRALFRDLPVFAALYSAAVFSLYWVFARSHLRRLAEMHGRKDVQG